MNLLTLEDLVQPDSAGYFWGNKDRLPPIVEGIDGKAMTLVGDGWLDMGNKRHHFDRTDPFSLSLWFRIDDESTYGPLLAKTSGLFDGDRGYHTFLNKDHTLTARMVHVGPDNELTVQTQDSVSTGSWHHIVMAYDGSSRASGLELYLDGAPMPIRVLSDNLRQSTTVTIDPTTGDSTNWAGPGRFTDWLIGYESADARRRGRWMNSRCSPGALTLPEVNLLSGRKSRKRRSH